MTHQALIKKIALFGVCLGLVVVGLGAYTRLKDAGLGCPDWPGCYGQIVGVPHTPAQLAKAAHAYPKALPVVSAKAWPEVIHRYFAGTLGLVILCLFAASLRLRQHLNKQYMLTIFGLTALLVMQATLGMWTVTWLLMPIVVMSHLVGGMLITCLLWYLANLPETPGTKPGYFAFACLAFGLTLIQIILGGWTSTNYAALICPDFPTCLGHWLPPMDLRAGFHFFGQIGLNYEGGILPTQARVAIQVVHRIGAVCIGTYLFIFAGYLWKKYPHCRPLALTLAALLVGQITLGILNVKWLLPMTTAVSHNLIALCLLLTITRLLRPAQ